MPFRARDEVVNLAESLRAALDLPHTAKPKQIV
jgi:hypothetical protein